MRGFRALGFLGCRSVFGLFLGFGFFDFKRFTFTVLGCLGLMGFRVEGSGYKYNCAFDSRVSEFQKSLRLTVSG